MTTEVVDGSDTLRMEIAADRDVLAVRQHGRERAAMIGFGGSELTVIATAISEIARNIVTYAGRGEMLLSTVHEGKRVGISIVAIDSGPGIEDVERALRDGFSTGNSLGLGLPGARRLMDDFEIESKLGSGTKVSMTKWIRR